MSTVTELQSPKSAKLQFAICFVGIFIFYLLYGIIIEFITKTEFGVDHERFTFTYCLVYIQCIVSALFSKAILRFSKENESEETTPQTMFSICSLTYLAGRLASNEALQHVSYPTQVLGKSMKPVPVMLLGVLIARKRYTCTKYFGVVLIVLGIVLFMNDRKSASTAAADESSRPSSLFGLGESLLLFSLTMDGFTGAIQDKMNACYSTKAHTMMHYMNLWSCLWLLFAVTFSGEIFKFTAFIEKNPSVLMYLLLLSFLGCLGQHFIYTTITTFGSLTCSIITTTRKFFTILLSVFIFRNPLSFVQWSGCFLVFTGLAIERDLFWRGKKEQSDKFLWHGSRDKAKTDDELYSNGSADQVELIGLIQEEGGGSDAHKYKATRTSSSTC